jgi:hypothetical protein
VKGMTSRKILFVTAAALCLALVFFLAISFFSSGERNATGSLGFLLTRSAFAQNNHIVTEGADSVWETSTQPSDGLTSVVSAVSPRILTEYADSILTQNLEKAEQLGQQAAAVSPRILVEYADSILSINLERPTAIFPTPSEPPATTTTPTQTSTPTTTPTLTSTPISPTPTQTELQPGQPYVNLYGQKTNVSVGEEIIISLSVVNPITSPGTLLVQLTLKIPSGWSITSSGFGHVVGGMSTNAYEIEQGPNTQAIEVHILANEAYTGNVIGYMDYYFIGEEPKHHTEATLPVTANPPEGSQTSTPLPPPTKNGSEDQGISTTAIAIIIGVFTATVGGVLARIIYHRRRKPVPVTRNTSDELRPSSKNGLPYLVKEPKDVDTLAPARIPEGKIPDITEDKKETNQDIRKIITDHLGSKTVDSLSQQVLDELIAAEKNYQKKEESSKAIIDFCEAVTFCLQQYFAIKVINKVRNITRNTQQPDFRFKSIALYECSQIFSNIDDPNPDKIESPYLKRQWSLIRDATTQAFPKLDKGKLTLLANQLREIQKLRNRHAHKESEVMTGPRPWHEDRRDLEYMRNIVLGSGQKVSVIVEIVEMFK